jgi:chromosome segregation ATPase
MSNEDLGKKVDGAEEIQESGTSENYDNEWDRLEKQEGEKGEGDGDIDDPIDPPADPPEDLDEGEIPKKAPLEKEKEDLSEHHGTVESLEKALKDTKKYAGNLQAEVNDLKTKVDAFEKGKATAEEVEEAKRAVKDAQDNLDEIKEKVYEDYPELKALIDPLIEHNRELKKQVEGIKEKDEESHKQDAEKDARQKAVNHFNENIKPKILVDHSDFDGIMKDPEYWSWADQQRPSLKTAAAFSDDPDDINYALTEFKKFKHSDEAEALRTKDKEKRDKKLKNAQTIRGGATPFQAKGKADEDDYDGGWAEAGKVLDKEERAGHF